jgi:GxxExxY protein
MLTRVTSALDAETEHLVEQTIGCAIEVHRALGPGYLEGVYGDAMAIELDHRGLKFGREVPVSVKYRDQHLRIHRLDLVVDGKVLVELKSVERLDSVHQSQVVSYLRASKLQIGLLINFNVAILKTGLRRVVL